MSENLPATITTRPPSVFSGEQAFEAAQRMAKALCSSSLVPEEYRGQNGLPNAMIALEMAQRVGASPMAVMQNLHIIQGRPSWSSSFIIASLNSCGRFSPLRFEIKERGQKSVEYSAWTGPKGQRKKTTSTAKIDDISCRAWAYDTSGEKLIGPVVSLEMAVMEGWYTKNDSKWKTMPELMLRYRAAAFFGRLYAPDILMGMHTDDEVQDVGPREITTDAAPVLVTEVEETETVEPKTTSAPETEPELDRDAIKAELDRLEVDYSSRAQTKTLQQLLEDAQAQTQTQIQVEEDQHEDAPPPLMDVDEPEQQPQSEQQQQPEKIDLF